MLFCDTIFCTNAVLDNICQNFWIFLNFYKIIKLFLNISCIGIPKSHYLFSNMAAHTLAKFSEVAHEMWHGDPPVCVRYVIADHVSLLPKLYNPPVVAFPKKKHCITASVKVQVQHCPEKQNRRRKS